MLCPLEGLDVAVCEMAPSDVRDLNLGSSDGSLLP